MDHLWEIAAGDIPSSSEEGRPVFGDVRGMEEDEDEEEEEEDDAVEEDEEDEEDAEDEEEDEEAEPPVKRQRDSSSSSSSSSTLSRVAGDVITQEGARATNGGAAGSPGSSAVDPPIRRRGNNSSHDNEGLEVIEILSDDEGLNDRGTSGPASTFFRPASHRSRSSITTNSSNISRQNALGARGASPQEQQKPGPAGAAASWHARPSTLKQEPRELKRGRSPTSGPNMASQFCSSGGGNSSGDGGRWHIGGPCDESAFGSGSSSPSINSNTTSNSSSSHGNVVPRRTCSPRSPATGDSSTSAGAHGGNPTAGDNVAGMGKELSWSAWTRNPDVVSSGHSRKCPAGAGGMTTDAVSPRIMKSITSTSDAIANNNSSMAEFPLNLECSMCFNPLAVVALFACGHGSCWECAHDWCSRGTSLTMDCPTCHVSVPRKDFLRCIVLDEVVEKAVIAAGMDGQEWQTRLERGQKLARDAEAGRRSRRDAQRSAEDIIAEQAAELKRLQEEAKSRAPSRWRRSHEGPPPAMAEYGFRRTSGREVMDSASQRSAMDELARLRHRWGEAGEPIQHRRGAMAFDPSAPGAAATLGMPPSAAAHGGIRSRHHPSSTPASPYAHTGEEPWISLRSSQPSRQTGVAVLGGRSNAPGRSTANGHAMGSNQSAGGMLRSAYEPNGSNWRSAYLDAGFLHRPSSRYTQPPPAARARNSALSSLYAMNGAAHPPAGSVNGSFSNDPVSGLRRLAPQVSTSASARKRYSFRQGQHSGIGGSAPIAAPPAVSGSSASAPFSTGPGSAAVVGLPFPQQYAMSQSSSGASGVGRSGGASGAVIGAVGGRFDEPDSDLEPLDVLSRHEELAGGRSEWDDLLAAVDLPHQGVNDRLRRGEGSAEHARE